MQLVNYDIPNIYTILDKIEFNKQIERICKMNNIENKFLIEQNIFKIIQEFYDVILDTEIQKQYSKE